MGRVFACSDLHGCLDLYNQIKAFLEPDDKVYFLGDAIDRGPESWKTMQMIYRDPQFIYMKGNHEDMLVRACEDYLWHDTCAWDYYSYQTCYRNGGEATMKAWEEDKYREEWVNILRTLPYIQNYTNKDGIVVLLSHAGFTPWLDEDGDIIYPSVKKDLLWDRDHPLDDWSDNLDNVVVIHGHTPNQYMMPDFHKEYEPGAFWYCDDHKCCIDNASFYSGITCLLDLDTFDEHIFQTKNLN